MSLQPACSEPDYSACTNLDLAIETRDGISLATDVYRPADPDSGEPIAESVPALLERTPYGKRDPYRIEQHGRYFARRGYVVAIQDVRGRFASDGEFYLLANEAEDGADAVRWLSSQDYCDGQVGTIGTSYGAWVQNALATQNPDGLAAMSSIREGQMVEKRRCDTTGQWNYDGFREHPRMAAGSQSARSRIERYKNASLRSIPARSSSVNLSFEASQRCDTSPSTKTGSSTSSRPAKLTAISGAHRV